MGRNSRERSPTSCSRSARADRGLVDGAGGRAVRARRLPRPLRPAPPGRRRAARDDCHFIGEAQRMSPRNPPTSVARSGRGARLAPAACATPADVFCFPSARPARGWTGTPTHRGPRDERPPTHSRNDHRRTPLPPTSTSSLPAGGKPREHSSRTRPIACPPYPIPTQGRADGLRAPTAAPS